MIKIHTEDETFTSDQHTVRSRAEGLVRHYEGNVFLTDTSKFTKGQSVVVDLDHLTFNAQVIKIGRERLRLISNGAPLS